MADFLIALDLVLAHEGGYANDPADRGGETFAGISRRFHPSWSGWKRIDTLRHHSTFLAALAQDLWLREQVRAFYKVYYFDSIGGDELTSQELANELLDIAVNLGTDRAVKFLQRAITALWRDPNVEPPIVDGRFGDTTAARLVACLAADPRHLDALLTLLNVQQGAHYLEQLVQYPAQRVFAIGWTQRIRLPRAAHAAGTGEADPA